MWWVGGWRNLNLGKLFNFSLGFGNKLGLIKIGSKLNEKYCAGFVVGGFWVNEKVRVTQPSI